MKLHIETVTLPAHWASALINGDYSGCTYQEEKEINAWIKDNPHYGPCHGCSESPELVQFDGLLTECLTYDFPVNFYTSRDYDFVDGAGKQHIGQIHSLIYPAQVKDRPMYHHIHGLPYTASGYGRKIPTSKMVLLCGVWRRVYCTIYSNAGNCWINFDGKEINVESIL